MKSIEELILIIKKLRAPDGCPWDREQTHDSIRGHLVEECAEFLDAVDAKNYPNMCEELGDILLHIALHSEIASEEKKFTFDDVVNELNAKLIRRHPHVFSDVKAQTSSDVLDVWKSVKAVEKKSRIEHENFWLNLPKELSGLRKAYDVAKQIDKRAEEKSAKMADTSKPNIDFGKRIYELVSECVKNKVEPEAALRDYLKVLRENS